MIMDREKLLQFAKNDDERMLLSKIFDASRSAEKYHSVKTTQFLNEHELLLAHRALAKGGDVCFSAYGGYAEACRKIIAFYPEKTMPVFNIHIIGVCGRELDKLTHRDYLGSVLALGIRREKIGDIIVGENGGFIFCLDDISEYIINGLGKIANRSVKLKLCSESDIIIPEKKFEEINATVSSLRLDCVLSVGLKVSRNDAAGLIKSERVSVNWEVTESTSRNVPEGSVISVKGFGRLELAQICGQTKKGRISIIIKRIL